MNWQEIRDQYPNRWLLLEAYGAYTEKGKRVFPHLEVVGDFGDNSSAAWARYRTLKDLDPRREYFMYHTSNEKIDIQVLDQFMRPVRDT